jgi:ribosomal protein S27AE
MDECLPLGSLDAPTLRMLLEKERARRAELEQEVTRLQAALARQNQVILRLEHRDAERQRELGEMRTLMAGLTEQNALLRQQVAQLAQENARLQGMPLAPPPHPGPAIKPATPKREQQARKKRAAEHNRGRLKLERPNRWETHAAESCPRCGEQLAEGWIQRRIQVIDLPPVTPLEITEHRIIRRQCPRCGKRVLPKPVGLEASRIARCRFGPRLLAAIATMATIERLPGRMIQERLAHEYGLTISHGGIVGLLQRMATRGQAAYEQLQQDVRASPVVHADETGWREDGQHTTVWTVSTGHTVYVSHGRRTNEEIDGILGADFGGTIVADCYAAYDHFVGAKQRCWAHLVRDLAKLLAEHGEDIETVAWVEGIREIYAQARLVPPSRQTDSTYQAGRAREQRARQCEALILLLCPAEPDPCLPYATLAKRLRAHLAELFTFVRDPRVAPTNNAAERSLRPLVIARKVSGGTRSQVGSSTRMVLYSLGATARLQGKDPTAVYHQILLAPPGTPSPLSPQHSHPL